MRKRDSQRLLGAGTDYLRAQTRLQTAHKRVEDFTRHLFTALKDEEAAQMVYSKAAQRLRKLRGGEA